MYRTLPPQERQRQTSGTLMAMATSWIGFTLDFTLVITYALLVKESIGGKVILLLLSLMCLPLIIICTDCRFEYRRQPPSRAQLTSGEDCTPYTLLATPGVRIKISLILECVVRREPSIHDSFEIRWFRKNTNGGVEDLGRGYPEVSQGNNDWISTYHNTKLFNQQYSSSFAGKYWCQVINTTADSDQPLMRSNVFTLLPPDNYTGPHCSPSSSFQVIDNVTCADLPVHSELNTLHDASVVTQTTHLHHLG